VHIGTVFDVTHKRETYGKGGSYNLFAGKDASKALGKSSLKEEDASPDYSDLPPAEMKVLDDWHAFFSYVAAFVYVVSVADCGLCVGNGTTLLAEFQICLLRWPTYSSC
jgi:membrane-associated progesterone receptor component